MTYRLLFALVAVAAASASAEPLRVAIAGLNHGHVTGFLREAQKRTSEVSIVAVWDPDAALLAKYARSHHFAEGQLFTDLNRMLDSVKPQAVATFTDTFAHAGVVEACAPRLIPVMMEKPLAVDLAQARAMAKASALHHTPVFVNYETTWYRSHGEIWTLAHERKALGEIRKMVAMDGHEGPKEIHVQPEFLDWLGDRSSYV